MYKVLTIPIVVMGLQGAAWAQDAGDSVPDPFSFVDQAGVPLSSEMISDPVTITGLDVAATVRVANGSYSIDNGPFTVNTGSIANGQTVKVRVLTATTPSTTTSVTLSVGGVRDSFDVTTESTVFDPSLSIVFPPPHGAFDGNEIDVAGTMAVPVPDAVIVEVDGGLSPVSATIDPATGLWRAENVPVFRGAHTGQLNVTVTDTSTGEVIESFNRDFDVDPRIDLVGDIAYRAVNDSVLLADKRYSALVEVDLVSGSRRMLSGQSVGLGPDFPAVHGFALDEANGRAFVASGSAVFMVDLATGDRTILADDSIGTGADFVTLKAVEIDTSSNRLLLLDSERSLLALDLSTLERTVISSEFVGAGYLSGDDWLTMTFDAVNNRVVVLEDYGATAIFGIDLATGDRTVISSDELEVGTGQSFYIPQDIAMDLPNNTGIDARCLLQPHCRH